ncbi:MAG: RsmD family RNA methyltransferase [Betaproteobacteria bacterium]
MRIVGGQFKRTPLPVADLPGLRPTPDRVRETLFNWLAHLVPDWAALRGLDLFAGTGALGLELASRGACAVTLVEREPQLVAQLQALCERLGTRAVQVLRGDALALAARLPVAGFDLVVLDPPFGARLHEPALRAVRPLLAPGGWISVEADGALPVPLLDALGLTVVRELRAGRVQARLLQAAQPAPPSEPDKGQVDCPPPGLSR